MSAPPYMKLYVADYLADTMHLTATQHGAYMLLLMAMWRAGGKLPAQDANLARIARMSPREWSEIKPAMLDFFQQSRGKLTHKRVTLEMSKYDDVSGKRSVAGKRGAEKKRQVNKRQALAIADFSESNCLHNQNQNQNQKSSDTNVSGGEPPGVVPFDPDQRAWSDAVSALSSVMAEVQARAFFGKLLATNKLLARDMAGAAATALANRTQDPAGYLTKSAASITTRRSAGALGRGNASFT